MGTYVQKIADARVVIYTVSLSVFPTVRSPISRLSGTQLQTLLPLSLDDKRVSYVESRSSNAIYFISLVSFFPLFPKDLFVIEKLFQQNGMGLIIYRFMLVGIFGRTRIIILLAFLKISWK